MPMFVLVHAQRVALAARFLLEQLTQQRTMGSVFPA